MQVTEHWSFRSQPRIDRKGFIDYARASFAQGAIAERDPGQYWQACVDARIDPLFILAMFTHESSCGKAGVARTSHSWGNTRWPAFGPTPTNAPPDAFAFYATWLDGLLSTLARLNADYVYRTRFTIKQLFVWPPDPRVAWAPAFDNNDPDGYLATVVRFMNKYKTHDGDVAFIDGLKAVPEVIVNWLDGEQANVLDTDQPYTKFTGVTNHETDNPDGAGALAHARYLREGGVAANVSWHASVDHERIVVHLPLYWRGKHAGDNLGAGSWTYAVEICNKVPENLPSEIWEPTLRNAAWLNAQLLRIVGLNTGEDVTGWNISDKLSQHNRWSGKDCPHHLRATGRWQEHIIRTARALQGTATTPPEPKPTYRYFPETGKTMGHGFLRFWEDNGQVPIFGYPLTEEYDDPNTGFVSQMTERARFEWHPAEAPENQVMLGRVGAELMEASAELFRTGTELLECQYQSMLEATPRTSEAAPPSRSTARTSTTKTSKTKKPSSPSPTTGSATSPPTTVEPILPVPSTGSVKKSSTSSTSKPTSGTAKSRTATSGRKKVE